MAGVIAVQLAHNVTVELKNSVADKRFRMTATVWLTQNVSRAATGPLLQQCN
jgi:hypothetical protein